MLNYRGLIATIIAGALGASVILTITGLVWRDKQVSPAGGEVLVAMVSGLLVALGYYMGSRANDK